MASRPENVVLLTGLPRSGVAELARSIGSHSRVDILMEPYGPDDESSHEADLERLCAEAGIELRQDRSLLLPVTASEPAQLGLAMETLNASSSAGGRCAVILAVRSPLDVFIDETTEHETPSRNARERAASIGAFWRSAQGSLEALGRHLHRFARRAVLEAPISREPRLELARLMALFPYEFESAQANVVMGASPTAEARSRREAFRAQLASMPAARHLFGIDELLGDFQARAHYDDAAFLDQLLLEIGRRS